MEKTINFLGHQNTFRQGMDPIVIIQHMFIKKDIDLWLALERNYMNLLDLALFCNKNVYQADFLTLIWYWELIKIWNWGYARQCNLASASSLVKHLAADSIDAVRIN